MTEKRFVYIEHKGADYILDSPNYDLDYIEMLGDTLEPKEIVDLLNEQHEQIQELIQSSKELEEDCQSTFNAMSRKQDDLYRKNFKLKEENEQLRTKNNAYIQDIEVFKEENTHLKLENEQLQARNDRQAKRLDRLYQLIGEKDWRALSDIMDDFKRCEEQLQREWRTYE